jgi:hypothetical protein
MSSATRTPASAGVGVRRWALLPTSYRKYPHSARAASSGSAGDLTYVLILAALRVP